MTIGTRIRQARRALNLTQKQLADAVGVEQQTVSGWEGDPARRPARDLMPKIAAILRRNVDWLERGGVSDEGRTWEAPKTPEISCDIDQALLMEVMRMAMVQMVKRYGVDIPPRHFEDAADAAASAYVNYFRLKSRDDAA